MEKLTIFIEQCDDFYNAYAENCNGVYGAGATVEAAIESVRKGLKLRRQSSFKLPSFLKDNYEVEYTYELPAFLNWYSQILGEEGLANIIDIHSREIYSYMRGHKRPTRQTMKKIENAIRAFGKELSQTRLYS
ncbi:MAG: hypothetical protein LBS12_04460 [Prevotellaceae bacterium]|jgi:transposase InsO family protein|nr:hypothetical protein [Prevotellaceae bacterium]